MDSSNPIQDPDPALNPTPTHNFLTSPCSTGYSDTGSHPPNLLHTHHRFRNTNGDNDKYIYYPQPYGRLAPRSLSATDIKNTSGSFRTFIS
jgi:hypothetical protein